MLSRGTVSERWSQSIPNTVIRLVVVSVLLFGMAGFRPPLPVQAAPAYGLLQNIGDFLSLGANTMRELQKAIELASSEMKSILIQVQSMINETMNMLEVKFQNNLNYSLSSLDAATWNILQQL